MHNVYISGIAQDIKAIKSIIEAIEENIENTKCWSDILSEETDMSCFSSQCSPPMMHLQDLKEYEIVIFVASKESRMSKWVFRELTFLGQKLCIPLYAVVIDNLDFKSTSRSKYFKGFSSIEDIDSLLTFVRNNLRVEQEYDAFISYSRKDYDKVVDLKRALETRLQGLKCWFDIDGIESGDKFETKIISAIDKSKCFLFAISENSKESEFVKKEYMYANNVGKRIVPIVIDGSKLSGWPLFHFADKDYTDISNQIQFEKLIKSLSNWLNIPSSTYLSCELKNQDISDNNSEEELVFNPSTGEFEIVLRQNKEQGNIITSLPESYWIDSLDNIHESLENAAVVDIDGDGVADIIAVDQNANGEFEDDEIHDISDEKLKLHKFDNATSAIKHAELDRKLLERDEFVFANDHPMCNRPIESRRRLIRSVVCDDTGDDKEVYSESLTITGNLITNHGILDKWKNNLRKLWNKKKQMPVYTCAYAPAQAKVGSEILIQVFLHFQSEAAQVETQAKSVDASSTRRNGKQISVYLKNGEVIDVELSIPAISINRVSKSMTWYGHYESVEFAVRIPSECKHESLLSTVTLLKQHIPVAEMSFRIELVLEPNRSYAEIFGHIFRRAFISYSHKDKATVEPIANQLRSCGIEYFYDKHTLKAGDRFRDKIRDWLELSDLFILCWSKNSEGSKEVEKERQMAMEISRREDKSLRICPFVINPQAPIPEDMIDIYHFTEL